MRLTRAERDAIEAEAHELIAALAPDADGVRFS
jgi:hypothetical protein